MNSNDSYSDIVKFKKQLENKAKSYINKLFEIIKTDQK